MKPFGAGQIEVGFVDGNHFDDGRKLPKDLRDAVAPFRILFMVAVEENGVWAKPPSGPQRHGRVDTVLASFVAGGGDDAALIGTPTDNHGLPAQVGAVQEFHGNEESVHIHMEDGGVGRDLGGICRGVVFRAEASKVRHANRVRWDALGGNNTSSARRSMIRVVDFS